MPAFLVTFLVTHYAARCHLRPVGTQSSRPSELRKPLTTARLTQPRTVCKTLYAGSIPAAASRIPF
jgi:hypothetical protein